MGDSARKMRIFAALFALFSLCHASSATVELNNGVEMPALAFAANLWDAGTCKTATAAALDAGFRFVWSSALIGDACQTAQGQAINASSVKRGDLFIAGTVNSQGCA